MKKILIVLLVLIGFVSCNTSPKVEPKQQSESMTTGGSDIARWEADFPDKDQGLSLIREKDADWQIEKLEGVSVASIVPVNDYQRRAAFIVRMNKAPVAPAWLTVEYLDNGLGMISVSSRIPAADQWGVARLNTGKIRHALFRLEPTAVERPLKIFGVEHLRSLHLSDSEPAREPIPDVQPAVKFQRPINLVMGGLTDVMRDSVADAVARLRNQLPLVRALGFNGIESYVKWNAVERNEGVFDWSYYDAIVAELEKHGLKWSPFVISGPAYTLPKWFHESPDFLGYECLEHKQRTDVQTIFSDTWPKYVQSYLKEFGKHYGEGGALLEMNLGISGCYGEVLYPASAGANMGYLGLPLHAHDGYWASGSEAVSSFQIWLRSHYTSIGDLNKAWQTEFKSFENVETFLPAAAKSSRQKMDFYNWYLDAMSDWADRWNEWAKEALPQIPIYQKVGGWENVLDGADFTRVTSDAARRGVSVRETTEHDNFAFNFGMIRLLSTASRFYGTQFGMEPAGSQTARGVVSRLFGAVVNNADQLFYYVPNLFNNDQSIAKWLDYAPLLDHRAEPLIDIAAFFPTSAKKLDETGRSLTGPFFTRSYSLRAITDHDFISEQMIMDGALDRYKVLVFLWGDRIEKPVLERISQWVKTGGTVITPFLLQTIEGDNLVMQQWEQGETGKGRLIRYRVQSMISFDYYYVRFVHDKLLELNELNPDIMKAMRMEKPETVYWSVLKSKELVILNDDDEPATVRFEGRTIKLEPHSIFLKQLR